MDFRVVISVLVSVWMFSVNSITAKEETSNKKEKYPLIINIVNYIRQTD